MPRPKATDEEILAKKHEYNGPSYFTMDGSPAALKHSEHALDEYVGVSRNKSVANSYNYDYRNIDSSGASGRPGMTYQDYYAFRPDEAPPTTYAALISECERVYRKVGVIRNIIDLMGDFASQGVRVVCEDKKEEKIYRKWFKKVAGQDRSERFLNNLYRTGNVYVRIITGKATITVRRDMRAEAAPDTTIEKEEILKSELPCRYVFLDPRTVGVVGGALANFSGDFNYELIIPPALRRLITSPKNPAEKEIINKLPADILAAASQNKPYVLPKGKVRAFYYKKDDWCQFGSPMIEGILSDINILEKLKLADMASLDGATSNVRIFRLGSMEHNIAPTRAAAAKLASLLQANVSAGTYDIIWGPDIDLLESKSDMYKFLGEEKYRPHLNSVYSGLGIPPTLTGTFGTSGTTNNFISLKTLIERLQYGRDILTSFWEVELEKVRVSLEMKNKARLEFTRTNLTDDNSEKKLWIDLADRGIVSDELLQNVFGADPDMEMIRIIREGKEREKGNRPEKAGPYYDPMYEIALRKIALQAGYISPQQANVKIEESSEPTPFDTQMKLEKEAINKKPVAGPPGAKKKATTTKKKGTPGQGRPLNKKDSTKRKSREFKPRTKAIELWAIEAQAKIADVMNPYIISLFEKKNMRSLSSVEFEQAEKIRFGVLGNLKPLSELTEENILSANEIAYSKSLLNEYISFKNKIGMELSRELTLEEQRRIQIMVCSKHWSK